MLDVRSMLIQQLSSKLSPGGTKLLGGRLMDLILEGWQPFYREIFGDTMVDSLDSAETDDKHHSEAIEWHWMARLALLSFDRPPNDWFAYFPIWSRGNMKSTIAEDIIVTDAMLSFAFGQPGYAMYLGREKDRVGENITNLETILSSARVRRYAPELSQVARNDETDQRRKWTGTFLQTAARYVIKGSTVDSAQAGSRMRSFGDEDANTRPTIFVPDDVDDREESPVIAKKRFKKLTTEILPMRQWNTLTFFAQNLINKYSTTYRIQKGQAKVLVNRKPTKPIPAVREAVYEVQTVDGIVKDVCVSGKCTWRGWDLQRINDEISTYGLPAFRAECQHEVDLASERNMLHAYKDGIHVISISEFASRFGYWSMPRDWPKEWGNDWARTKSASHANVAAWRTVSNRNTPLPGFTFVFHPMSFKANAQPEDVAERVLSCLEEHVGVEDRSQRPRLTRDGPVYPPKEGMTRTWAELRRDELMKANSLMHTTSRLEQIEFEHSILQDIIPQYSEKVLALHTVVGGVMSHERDDIQLLYNRVYGMKCQGVNPGKFGGLEQWNRDLAINPKEEHPFRTYLPEDDPRRMGYTRWFVVVPDDLEAKPVKVLTKITGEMREIEIYPPEAFPDEMDPADLHDDKLYRYQMVNWQMRPPKETETGEAIDEVLKMNDDFGNLGQMWQVVGALENTPHTPREEMAMLVNPDLLPQKLEDGTFKPVSRGQQAALEFNVFMAKQELKEKHGDDYDEDDNGLDADDDEVDDGPHWYD